MTNALTTRVSSRELIRKSVSEKTKATYRDALHRLEAWLSEEGYALDDQGLAEYLTYLFNEGKSPATASIVISAVRFFARKAKLGTVVGEQTRDALSAYKRELSHAGKGQAHGLRWEDADKIAKVAVQDGDLTGYRDAAVIAVMSDALLRVSEVAALQVYDIEDLPGNRGVLHIRRSKTDQKGKGASLYLGTPTMVCLKNWLLRSGIQEGPVFRKIYKDVVQPTGLTTRTMMRIIKRRAHEAGIEENVSGHSFRVGSAQSLAHAGATLVDMQIAGRWRSPNMPARYARAEMASRGAVARLRYSDMQQ